MKKWIFILISLLMVLAMIMTVGAASQPASVRAVTSAVPRQNLQPVPAELQAEMEGGIPVAEFLASYDGRVPNALAEYSNERVTVVVEMQGDPLAAVYAAGRETRQAMSVTAQREYLASLSAAQAPVRASLTEMGGTVISQYTKVYNGILVNIPLKELANVKRLPGVAAVHRAPVHTPALEHSVPLINADDVIDLYGTDGTGTTIAVIDTGIDYYHAAFGGSGDPQDYADDDPDIIEPGTFPTAKVIGGYDFAGTNYNADSDNPANTIPVPDDDPLDEVDHGTHVASIAAGEEVNTMSGTVGAGVAPGASLYALKVFGAEGSTNLTVDAIEWAADPNQDGDLSDRVDVINMSLGSDYGPNDPAEPDIIASNYVSMLGTVVVASAGNAGDVPYIAGSPANADAVISVAASTTGYVTGPLVSVPEPIRAADQLFDTVYQPPEFDGDTGHFTTLVSAPLAYAGNLSGAADDLLCTTDGLTAGAMTGSVALIQRGDCAFTVKVNNAAALGAVGALIFNSSAGGDDLFTMIGDPVLIPAGMIGHSAGVDLSAYDGDTVDVAPEDQLTTIENVYVPADTAATFTSRGPRGFDSVLKPDIAAPGVSIAAAKMGSGTQAVALSGTSMASPHVAGVAALLREGHPDWAPGQIKAAMMNTAVDLNDPASAQVPRQGAGRVDALASYESEGILTADAQLVSLNWGLLQIGTDSYANSKQLTLQNLSTTEKTYDVSWDFGPLSYTSGFSLTLPLSVTVGASPGFAYIPVDLTLDTTAMSSTFGEVLEEYNGYITLTNEADAVDTLRVPFYAVVEPYPVLNLAGALTNINAGEIEISHSGPISSSLWTYPLLSIDANEPGQGDEGDVRMFGMDYGWYDSSFGDFFVPAINTYGTWHTPQPYFAEFDFYLDVDGDGFTDFIDWNSEGSVVYQYEVGTGFVYLASPYLLYSDFNTGFMEWYLPAAWHGLGGSDTDMDYLLYGFDYHGNADMGAMGAFDYARPPFMWSISGDPGPADPTAWVNFELYDAGGYALSQPLGLMVVDYLGKGGSGQAYAYEFNLDTPFRLNMPVIGK